MEMTWLISEALTWDFNFGYLDAEIDKALELDADTGQLVDASRYFQMARAPEYTLSTTLTWDLSLGDIGDLRTLVQAYYSDETPTVQPHDERIEGIENSIADSYTLWNAQAIYTTPDQRWNVAAWVKNIGDERVITDGYLISPIVFVSYNAPRTYGASVEYRF
jgi:iron complex outermembrane receptor protein